MDKLKQEVIKYTTKDFLLNFLDLSIVLMEVFSVDKAYRVSLSHYRKWREEDKKKFDELFRSLKHRGFIKEDNQKQEIELTGKAVGNLRKYCLEIIEVPKQKVWDGKFRIVIFDVPEKRKIGREVLRRKLKELGFEKLQGSVYVHPYPCKKEIDWIRRNYELESYVLYLEVEYLDESEKTIKKFVKSGLVG